MIFHIYYLVWKDGFSDIVDGISVDVEDADAAFTEAKTHMYIGSKKGATAFVYLSREGKPAMVAFEQIKSAREI